MDANKDKVIEKVTKLLNLANNEGASEGERENALRMAQNLLTKHNIEMLEVENYEQEEEREEVGLEFYHMNWTHTLANAVAKLFFCKYLIGRKINATKGVHLFYGKQSNAITAKLMTEYLIKNILKECRKNWTHNLCPESRSFALGASIKIRDRVLDMIANQEQEFANNSTSLVLKDYFQTELEKNEAFIKNLGINPGIKKARSSAIVGSAFNQGKEFGGNVSLNNQVTSAKNKPLLLN
jgi:hypothetical protein